VSVGGDEVSGLAEFFRKVWSLGDAGVDVPLLISRKGRMQEAVIRSADRTRFLKGPILH